MNILRDSFNVRVFILSIVFDLTTHFYFLQIWMVRLKANLI